MDDDGNAQIEKLLALTAFRTNRVKEMFQDLDGVVKFTFKDIDNASELIADTWADLTEDEKANLKRERHMEKSTPWSARKNLKHGKTVDKLKGEAVEFCWNAEGLEIEDEYTNPEEHPLDHLQDPRMRMTRCTIALDMEYVTDLRARQHSPEKCLEDNFRIANTILHELAHTVESGRFEHRGWDVEEAVFPGEVLPEMGCKLEKLVFRGTFYEEDMEDAPGSNCEADNAWLSSIEWPLKSTLHHFCVLLEWLARIQQQEFWDGASGSLD